MDQQEFADRTEAIKTRLYRTAYLYLGSEADALEAVDETVYRALRKLKQLQTAGVFRDLDHPDPDQHLSGRAAPPEAVSSRRGGRAAGHRRAGRLRASAAEGGHPPICRRSCAAW